MDVPADGSASANLPAGTYTLSETQPDDDPYAFAGWPAPVESVCPDEPADDSATLAVEVTKPTSSSSPWTLVTWIGADGIPTPDALEGEGLNAGGYDISGRRHLGAIGVGQPGRTLRLSRARAAFPGAPGAPFGPSSTAAAPARSWACPAARFYPAMW